MLHQKTRMQMKDFLAPLGSKFPKAMKKIEGTYPDIAPDQEYIRRAFMPEDIEFSESEKAMIGTITSLSKDSYNEVVLPEGMTTDAYSGIVLYNHDYTREDVPHAKNMWIKSNADNTALIAKTAYLPEFSELAEKVYAYRKGLNPLGQSIGFMPIEWKSPKDDEYADLYADWVERYWQMMKSRGVKKTALDMTEPDIIYTKWALLEYSDVFIPANADAVQIAVSKGLILEAEKDKYTEKELGVMTAMTGESIAADTGEGETDDTSDGTNDPDEHIISKELRDAINKATYTKIDSPDTEQDTSGDDPDTVAALREEIRVMDARLIAIEAAFSGTAKMTDDDFANAIKEAFNKV